MFSDADFTQLLQAGWKAQYTSSCLSYMVYHIHWWIEIYLYVWALDGVDRTDGQIWHLAQYNSIT